MNKQIFIILLFTLTIIFVGACASERAITGGPEDRTPPEILSSKPQSGSLSVSRNTGITIRFSEQMDKASVKSALQIWPRPPGGFEVKTGWTWVKVNFEQALEANETYMLTIDKTAKDLRGNKLEATYILAFSTGEEMNAGKIRGQIAGNAEVRKNGNILLFRNVGTDLSELPSDSANYIFQPDDDGSFELNYLKEQRYLLYYHWDRNRNRKIDAGDYFGRPERPTVFARSDSLISESGIWPQTVSRKKIKLLEISKMYE